MKPPPPTQHKILYKDEAVLTTPQLATLYECSPGLVRNNYLRNKQQFVEGEHFFGVEGLMLSELRQSTSFRGAFGRGRRILLWTRRGAARHAKFLNTPKAIQVFGELEASYFILQEVKETLAAAATPTQQELPPYQDERFQVERVKDVASSIYRKTGDPRRIAQWHKFNCIEHVRRSPKAAIALARKLGAPSEYLTSGRQAIRWLDNAAAASMAAADVAKEHGAPNREAVAVAKRHVLPFMRYLQQLKGQQPVHQLAY